MVPFPALIIIPASEGTPCPAVGLPDHLTGNATSSSVFSMYVGYTPISPRHSRFRGNPGASADTILPRRGPIDSHESGGVPAIPTHAVDARYPNHISKTVRPVVKICQLFPATLYCRQYRKPCVRSVSSPGYQAARIPSPRQSDGALATTSFGFCRENNRLQRQGESDRKGSRS